MSYAKLDAHCRALGALEHALAILGTDEATNMAPGGGESRAEAMATLKQQITAPPAAIIGSSLGGFLATVLAEQYGCRACLINPAVAPHKVLADYIGEYQHPVLQQRYQVRTEHMSQLASLMPLTLKRPEQYFVLLQSGDEVLDYRQALKYYQGARFELVEGGDHSFVGYQQYLTQIAEFCLQQP